MMTMAHAALGAAIGNAIPSPPLAAAAAFGAHALLDLPRHDDLDTREEAVGTASTIALCAGLFGLRSREFWSAFLCSCPDLEHVFRKRSRKLYPTHRWGVLHNLLPTPRLTAPAQVALSAAVLAGVARRARAAA